MPVDAEKTSDLSPKDSSDQTSRPDRYLIILGDGSHLSKYPPSSPFKADDIDCIGQDFLGKESTNLCFVRSNATDIKDLKSETQQAVKNFVSPLNIPVTTPLTTYVYYANIQTKNLFFKEEDAPADCYSFNNEQVVQQLVQSCIVGPQSKVVLVEVNEWGRKEEKATINGNDEKYQLDLLRRLNPEFIEPMAQLKSQIADLTTDERDSPAYASMKKAHDATKKLYDTLYLEWIIFRRQLFNATDDIEKKQHIDLFLKKFRSTVTTIKSTIITSLISSAVASLSEADSPVGAAAAPASYEAPALAVVSEGAPDLEKADAERLDKLPSALKDVMQHLNNKLKDLDKRAKEAGREQSERPTGEAPASPPSNSIQEAHDAMHGLHEAVYTEWNEYQTKLGQTPAEQMSHLTTFKKNVKDVIKDTETVLQNHRGVIGNTFLFGLLFVINTLYNVVKNLTFIGAYHNYTRHDGRFFPPVYTASRKLSVELGNAVDSIKLLI